MANKERRKEIEQKQAAFEAGLIASLEKSKQHSNREVIAGATYSTHPLMRKLCEAVYNHRKGILLANMGGGVLFANLLANVCEMHQYMIRGVDTWNCNTKNRDRIFSSLIRHLFARYDVPAFMDSIWYMADMRNRNHRLGFQVWCKVAQGENVRKVETRVPWTKRMAHIFLQSSVQYSYVEALRRAQIMVFREDNRLIDAINRSLLRDMTADEEFWATVIQWFCNQDMLDYAQVAPLIDFIRFRKEEEAAFSMKGRNPLRLIRDMEEWHNQLSKMKVSKATGPFPSSNLRIFEQEDRETLQGQKVKIVWKVEEILDEKALLKEGRDLSHCVYSYASSIRSGNTAIWSLRKSYPFCPSMWEPQVTIEVRVRDRMIVQARGSCNRSMTPKERRLVELWAASNNLSMRV